jgi:DNA-directed RNA polymerase subunit M/transcription elongation factor TFIIS
MDIPKKPEVPTYVKKVAERKGENRSRLGWWIACSKCGYEQMFTNTEYARDYTLKRLEKQQTTCPDCGAAAWEAVEKLD